LEVGVGERYGVAFQQVDDRSADLARDHLLDDLVRLVARGDQAGRGGAFGLLLVSDRDRPVLAIGYVVHRDRCVHVAPPALKTLHALVPR
jgi:hypothetical protein